jgi:hypothetical protein
VDALGDLSWDEVDAVVYFWVRASRVELEARLLAELRDWFAREWGFERTVFVTNEQFTRQTALLAGTDLRVRFDLREPDKAGTYLVFG